MLTASARLWFCCTPIASPRTSASLHSLSRFPPTNSGSARCTPVLLEFLIFVCDKVGGRSGGSRGQVPCVQGGEEGTCGRAQWVLAETQQPAVGEVRGEDKLHSREKEAAAECRWGFDDSRLPSCRLHQTVPPGKYQHRQMIQCKVDVSKRDTHVPAPGRGERRGGCGDSVSI